MHIKIFVMATIHIKNVGPLRDTGEVTLNKLLLVIGKQSSGKSTFMKVLCHCRWIEKTLMVDDDSHASDYGQGREFMNSLMTFHRFNVDFFSAESYIKYDGDYITIEQQGNESEAIITRKASFESKRYNTKLCFIPSERNLISAVKNIDKAYKATELDVLLNYLLEWDEVKDFYGRKNPLSISVAPLLYYNDGGADFIYINNNNKQLPVFYASSGVQSAMPIEVMIDRYSALVGKRASISKHDWRHIFDEMKDSEMSQDALVSKVGKAYYQSVQFFIEEPEQNLFPMSQKDLVLNIVSHLVAVQGQQSSMVVMTTHSPYVLSVVNELMAEARLDAANWHTPIAGADDFINHKCLMPQDSYSAFFINGSGTFEDLIDRDLPMVSGLQLDGVSDWVEERIAQINKFIYG